MDGYISILTILLLTLMDPSDGAQCSFNKMCTCSSGEQRGRHEAEISCVGVPFSKLPDFPRGSVETLSVIGSGAEAVSGDSFGDMKATSLNLMSNKIHTVHDHAFMVMYRTLENIDLSFNNLQEIPIEALLKLQKLKHLNLDSNEIASLNVDWGQLKETLTSLHLSGNDVRVLPSSPQTSLSSFRNLREVYLDKNAIGSDPADSLPSQLKLLSLSDNLLTEFPLRSLNAISSLEKLYLKNNYIEKLPNSGVNRKTPLAILDLSYNMLKSVNNVFDGSFQINVLNLASNYIENIAPNAFDGLAIVKLDLSRNELHLIPERAFAGLEFTLQDLDLSFNHLVKIPKALLSLKDLQRLSLDRNNFPPTYPDNLLKNCSHSIRSLSIEGNGITEFPKNILKNTKKISFLNLSYNKITKIDENHFSKWAENLATLILIQNSITELPSAVFKQAKKLTELNLSFNKIQKIDEKAFINNGEQLKTLDISFGLKNNEFPQAIKHLQSLIYLALSGNNITKLPKTGIYDLFNLQFFIMDFNQITEIPENFFHGKVHRFLKDVRLSFNKIHQIEPNTFSDLEELNYIVLNDNHITSIDHGAFKNLPNPINIILSSNKIDRIIPMSFINIPNLVSLDLSQNFLQEFSFNIFQNVTNEVQPMSLNLSRNLIENIYAADTLSPMFVKSVDLSHNKITQVPKNLLISVKTGLKKLDLGFNSIRIVDNDDLVEVGGLEVLNLNNNLMVSLKAKSFNGLHEIQILDLSHNNLEMLNLGQFKNMHNLRVLDLSFNLLRSLPKEAFHNTKLERLSLKMNMFVLIPATPFVDVGYTLRHVDFSQNQVEVVTRETFTAMPSLNWLDLSDNKLSHIQSHDFKPLASLAKLGLSGNQLGSLSLELGSLRLLGLARSGLATVPSLRLHSLASLDLSGNSLAGLSSRWLAELPRLRRLDLSANNITSLAGVLWSQAGHLKSLNLSYNPIRILTRESTIGLAELHQLDLRGLDSLERFDSDTLAGCLALRHLALQTWPAIERYRFQLTRVIGSLSGLRRLEVLIAERELADQLAGSFPRGLQRLDISGRLLAEIRSTALNGLQASRQLEVRISGTSLRSLPPGLFWRLVSGAGPRLGLDLRDNQLEVMDLRVFYQPAALELYGTKWSYPGNIKMTDNRLRCGCQTAWFSDWLRRQLIETAQVNADRPETNLQLQSDAKAVSCYLRPGESQSSVPLLSYGPLHSCQLTSAASSPLSSPIILFLALLLIF